MAVTGVTELGLALVTVTVDADPRVTSVDAPAGSTIIYVGIDTATIRNGDVFKKLDDGDTTNVSESSLKNSLNEAADPGVSDDNTQGYQVGSRWINTTLNKEFVCLNAATGAAVWIQTTAAGATDADAVHVNVAAEISAVAAKGSPTAADFLLIEDAADGDNKKSITIGDLPGGAGLPVVDTTGIAKGSADATKVVRFEVDGLTTGVTRVLTVPDKDITLVGIADVMLLDGTQAMTGTMTTVGIVPAADLTHSIGTASLAYDKVFTNKIGPPTLVTLFLQSGDGTNAITITDTEISFLDNLISEDIEPAAASTHNIGLTSKPYNEIFVNQIRAGSGQELTLRTTGGTTQLEIPVAGGLTFHADVVPNAASARSIGTVTAPFLNVVTDTIKPGTGNGLLFQTNTGVTQFSIPNGGGAVFAISIDFGSDNTFDVGDATAAIRRVFTGAVRAGTATPTLLIERGDGATWATIPNSGTISLNLTTRMSDNVSLVYGSSDNAAMIWDTTQTPDALMLGLSGSNLFTLTTISVLGVTDLAIANRATPTLYIHDGSINPTQGGFIFHDGTDFNIAPNFGDLELQNDLGERAISIPFGSAKQTLDHKGIAPVDNNMKNLGNGADAYLRIHVGFVRPNGTSLVLEDSTGNDVIEIADADNLTISPVGNVVIATGAASRLEISSTLTVFNPTGVDTDFQVQGDNDTVTLTVDAGLDRVGVGVALNAHLAKFHVAGGILGEYDVEAVASTPRTLIALESRRVFTNEGATVQFVHNLPPAAAGLTYSFIVQDPDGSRVNAATADTIRIGGTVSAAAGRIEGGSVGDTITLIAINAVEWVALGREGSWTVDGTTVGTFVTVDGQTPLTGDWDTGTNDILTQGIRARASSVLLFKASDGSTAITVRENQNVEFAGTILTLTAGASNVGASAKAFGTGFFRNLQPDTGDLSFRDTGGAEGFKLRGTSGALVMVAGDIESNADDARDIGKPGAQFQEIFVGIVKPGTTGGTHTLTLQSQDATPAIVITDTEITWHDDFVPVTTNSFDIGTTTVAVRTVHSRNLQGEDGFAFVIRDGGGAAAFQITQGGPINQFFDMSPGTDATFDLGQPDKAYVNVVTNNVKPGTGDTLNLQDEGGDAQVRILADGTVELNGVVRPFTNQNSNLGDATKQFNKIFVLEWLSPSGIISATVNNDGIAFMGATPPTGGNVSINKIAGATPVSNVTGLDSRKLGFISHLWTGTAQLRTGFIRTEDVSGEDDQLRFVFSSDDNGGSETDFLGVKLDTNVFLTPLTGNLVLESTDASPAITISNTEITFHDDMRPADDNTQTFGGVSNALLRLFTGAIRPGNGTPDLNIEGPNGNIIIKIDNDQIGFFGAATAAKATVTGERQGNAALADLLSELNTYGFITDSTVSTTSAILANGTVPLTATWNTGAFTILADVIRARPSEELRLSSQSGGANIIIGDTSTQLTVPTITQVIRSDSDNTRTIGLVTNQYTKVFTGQVSPSTGNNLIIAGPDESAAFTVTNTEIQVTHTLRMNDGESLQFGSALGGRMIFAIGQTVNSHIALGVDSTSKIFLITDQLRTGVDFNFAAAANPTLRIHDGSVTPGNFGSIFHDGNDFIIDNAKSATSDVQLQTAGVTRLIANSVAIAVGAPIRAISGDLEIAQASGTIRMTVFSTGEVTIAPATTLTVSGDLFPGSQNTLDLGSAGSTWDAIYVNSLRISTGFTHVTMAAGVTNINPIGIDLDTVIKGDNDGNLGFFNAGVDRVGIGVDPLAIDAKFVVEGTVKLKEQNTPQVLTAAYGQVWVKDDSPNKLFFTDDAGTDFDLLAGGDPTSDIAEASGDITKSSGTDDLATGMTLTPPSGTYLVSFTGSVHHTGSNDDIHTTIFSGGTIQASSEREFKRGAGQGNVAASFACRARVTVNGSQAIEGRWRTSGGTATMHERTLTILKVA